MGRLVIILAISTAGLVWGCSEDAEDGEGGSTNAALRTACEGLCGWQGTCLPQPVDQAMCTDTCIVSANNRGSACVSATTALGNCFAGAVESCPASPCVEESQAVSQACAEP